MSDLLGVTCTCEKFGLVKKTGGPKWYENCPIHRTRPEATLPIMDPAIARRLRAIANRLLELDAERTELILQARADGASLREIAEVAGMSHVGIMKLIDRHE